jgi:hypothetical protein
MSPFGSELVNASISILGKTSRGTRAVDTPDPLSVFVCQNVVIQLSDQQFDVSAA